VRDDVRLGRALCHVFQAVWAIAALALIALFAALFMRSFAAKQGEDGAQSAMQSTFKTQSVSQDGSTNDRSAESPQEPRVRAEGQELHVTVTPVCETSGTLVSTSRNGSGSSATWRLSESLSDSAEQILAFYRDQGGFRLEKADFLDLFGQVWGCLVQSDKGWAEMVLIDRRDAEGEGECTVTVVRVGQGSAERDSADAEEALSDTLDSLSQ
jgi:hypothetical protein